jgi:CRP/FNR family transcriptional regulator, anaerobic regulatory protein
MTTTPSPDIFRQLSQFTESELQEEILEHAQVMSFEKGDTIVSEGQFVKILPIVLTGGLRVYQTKAEREILLYYVEPSQTCMMSLSACFFNHESPSQAVAAVPTEALTIPARFVAKWQKAYNSWNLFVIRTFRNRYDELLGAFETVAFDHVDKRIFGYLKDKASKLPAREVEISHQALANEIGTTRVVVSRILKQFEMDKRVELHRGFIKVL